MLSKETREAKASRGGAEDAFGRWLSSVPDAERTEILGMDGAEREDAFYRDLAFGTGGLRGRLGLGPNRMNVYTVGKATQGLADYLRSKYEEPSVALCRDTRRGSEELVRRAAEVLAGNGIASYLFDRVEPTPALSFAVRELGCSAGVNVTASHNPAAYNGYKVYGADGCQVTVDDAGAIQAVFFTTTKFRISRLISFGFHRFAKVPHPFFANCPIFPSSRLPRTFCSARRTQPADHDA